jgi:hypothetical protein
MRFMGRCWAVLVVLGCGTLSGGCLFGHKERTTARLHSPPFAGVVGDDVIYLDVAFLERPLSETFLHRELWSEANEEVVYTDDDQLFNMERLTALQKNGFRVGQISGLLPTKLQDMLDTQRDCQARRIQLHSGHETTLSLGPSATRCCCRLNRDGRFTPVELTQAQCQLVVVPSLTDEGRIRLRFTPQILHGQTKTAFLPVRCADGQLDWARQERPAEESYPWLGWTLEVAPNDYVVAGPKLEKGETLGEQFFLTREEGCPIVQRLLVLRAAHVPTPAGPPDELADRCPPLALRASLIAARGSGE